MRRLSKGGSNQRGSIPEMSLWTVLCFQAKQHDQDGETVVCIHTRNSFAHPSASAQDICVNC